MACVIQDWVCELTFMKQSVLLTTIRGIDGVDKYHPSKYLLRWFRRCILLSAFDNAVLITPVDKRGGSFTGPSCEEECNQWEDDMEKVIENYFKSVDTVPLHFHMHLLHAAEILGYDHPNERIRNWWYKLYYRMVKELHLNVETKEQLNFRLGDSKEQWLQTAEKCTSQ